MIFAHYNDEFIQYGNTYLQGCRQALRIGKIIGSDWIHVDQLYNLKAVLQYIQGFPYQEKALTMP
jgi:hypothetical protein